MIPLLRLAARPTTSAVHLNRSVRALHRLCQNPESIAFKLNRSTIVSIRFGHVLPPSDPKQGGDAFLYPGYKPRPPGPKTVEDFANPEGENKNWVSYGFDYFDRANDRLMTHFHFFTMCTILGVVLVFLSFYYPDTCHLQNWAIREAYLELERREKLGLPLVDKNYIDPANMVLPSEEELKGIEIYY